MMGVVKTDMSASRLMRHPGPVTPVRITSCSEPNALSAWLELSPSVSLLDGLAVLMAEIMPGQKDLAASFEFTAGCFARVTFCTGSVDRTGEKLATYSPWRLARDAYLLGGAGTFGTGLDGQPLIHCHGWFARSKGEVCGGHLDPSATLCGAEGIRLRLFIHRGFSIRQRPDAETGHAVLLPTNRQEPAA